MEWISNLLGIGIASFATITVAIASNQNIQSPVTQPEQTAIEDTTSPRRLTVTVKVVEPNDLKIKQGQQLKSGDIIADRERERARLNFSKQQLQLSLERLKSSAISAPKAIAPSPVVKALPPISYLEHEATIEQAKAAIASIESQMSLKQQEIEYLESVPNLDPIILEHERAKLAQLKLEHTAVVREYQLAMGKLQTAKDKRAYDEYEASIDTAQRVEQINQTRLDYQQQLTEYEQRLADREFPIAQIQTKLDEVENAIAALAEVKAPYSATVRRIKWLGQSEDGSLTAEITLMVRNSQL